MFSDEENLSTNKPIRARRIPTRYQNMADVSVFLQDESDPAPTSVVEITPERVEWAPRKGRFRSGFDRVHLEKILGFSTRDSLTR